MKRLVFAAAVLCNGADLVLYNGRITTLDPARPQATAISITGGRITNIGTDAQVNRDIRPGVKAIDLGGRLVTPGLIEGHGHLVGLGQSKITLNLRDARNWDRIVAMVAAAAKDRKSTRLNSSH